jgi:hypothetical protein
MAQEPPDPAAPALNLAPDRNELERLEAEAKHHRARLALYRQRSYGGKADMSRLRDLQRASEAADARLKAARSR